MRHGRAPKALHGARFPRHRHRPPPPPPPVQSGRQPRCWPQASGRTTSSPPWTVWAGTAGSRTSATRAWRWPSPDGCPPQGGADEDGPLVDQRHLRPLPLPPSRVRGGIATGFGDRLAAVRQAKKDRAGWSTSASPTTPQARRPTREPGDQDRLPAMQPLPRWAKTFMFVALGLAAFVLVLVIVVDRTGPAQPADWRLDPAGALDPSSREEIGRAHV